MMVVCQGSAQAALCFPQDEGAANPPAKVTPALAWTLPTGVNRNSEVMLVGQNDPPDASLSHLATASFGSDDWARIKRSARHKAADAIPESGDVALATFIWLQAN